MKIDYADLDIDAVYFCALAACAYFHTIQLTCDERFGFVAAITRNLIYLAKDAVLAQPFF